MVREIDALGGLDLTIGPDESLWISRTHWRFLGAHRPADDQ
jgi:hypothetical protein